MNWDILTPEVIEVANKAAAKVARDYERAIEFEDAKQEAYTLVVTKSDLLACIPDDLGRLFYRLHLDLVDLVKYEARSRVRQVSYEVSREGRE